MHKFLYAFAATLLVAGQAAAKPAAISLGPGETVELRLDNGQLVVSARGKASPLSAHEAEVIEKMQAAQIPPDGGVQPAVPVMEGEIQAPPEPLTTGLLRISFRQVPGNHRGPAGEPHAVLSILNGFDQSLRYRAAMLKNGKVTSTDVCEVVPEMRGLEHWPYRIDRLDLSDLQLVPFEGGSPRCE